MGTKSNVPRIYQLVQSINLKFQNLISSIKLLFFILINTSYKLDTLLYKTIHFPHGYPNNELNKLLFNSIIKNQNDIKRIHVTHERMKNYLLENKIDENKIMKIYNSIDIEKFQFFDLSEKKINREKLNIKESDYVIGSFQKDGVGWKDGLKPKLEKGTDIFINIICKLKNIHKNLLVILTGPSRGFVINELKKNSIFFSLN